MELRLAQIEDLPKLKMVYAKIVENMDKNNIAIWNEVYPYEEFQSDIEKKNLYLLTEKEDIVAAFALYETQDGEDNMKWANPQEKSLYIGRVGVNANYLRQGIGGLVIKNAIEIAKQKDAKYLRLLVVDINKPAINLYLKSGFKQVDGYYEEVTEDITLIEYGFEIKI